MRGKELVRMLAGSAAIYVVMAACSASGGGRRASTGSGGQASSGSSSSGNGGGSGSVNDASLGDVISDALDEMMNPVDEAQAWISGTRLKVQRWISDDGAQQPVGLFDSQRNEACAFTTAGDGLMRCLPTESTVSWSGAYYSDATCSKPVAVYYATCAQAPLYFKVTDTATCPNKTRVASVGAVFEGAPYIISGGDCIQSASALCSDPDYCKVYEIGEDVDPAEFARGSLETAQ